MCPLFCTTAFARLGKLWRLLAESLALRLLLLASRSTGSRPAPRRSNADVGGRVPSLSFAGLVLWASLLSVNVCPTLFFIGVLQKVCHPIV